ncbi:enoyl-CoA hydratase-related protein [Sphingomicrobium lutaoense]|uniref:Enoyl-CoA hydratase/carnithine racemase n=1 Tax=Sphingomicrobium lutaoense TaxID=515949 RepID=A0A839Z0C9_9SPHN|nr:enoyl-CoA hydratase-related protein [Sphingomicrobium lutaoense]MBB3764018.1 enoyl-CoA hydratase/carnithine racemase [Sphingomicrobium lutaoense]
MSEQVSVERTHEGAVLAITLKRPEARNAITVGMYAALADAVEGAADDPGMRLITIRGQGEDFTAGNDLMDFLKEMPQPGGHEDVPVWRFLAAMAANEIPILAGVQGNAIGIGTTMLFHCDLVLAERGCRFKMPFVDLGLVPEAASSLILPRLGGRRRAARYLLLGEDFGADEALSMGLASHVADKGGLDDEFDRLIATILAKPAEAMRQTQALLRAADRSEIGERMTKENAHFAERLTSDEVKQAIADFFATRA